MLSSELHLSDLPHLNLQSCETDLYPENKTTILKEREGDAHFPHRSVCRRLINVLCI